jgi:hypothetical protein
VREQFARAAVFVRISEGKMTNSITAALYRKNAHGCIEAARQAPHVDRPVLLEIAQNWLAMAACVECGGLPAPPATSHQSIIVDVAQSTARFEFRGAEMPSEQKPKAYREHAAAIREMAALLKEEQARTDALMVAVEWDRAADEIEQGGA